MPRGGRRPGAGRKTNAQIQAVRDLLDDTLTEAQWRELIHNLFRQARRGNIRAAQLLLSYRFGDPYAQRPNPDGLPEPITFIEVHHAAPPVPPPPDDRSDQSTSSHLPARRPFP